MDVLHLKKEEIEVMDFFEFNKAVTYSKVAFTTRRIDLLAKAFGGETGGRFGDGQQRAMPVQGKKIGWKHPKIEDYINSYGLTTEESLEQGYAVVPPYKSKERKGDN